MIEFFIVLSVRPGDVFTDMAADNLASYEDAVEWLKTYGTEFSQYVIEKRWRQA
jgi:hypothetical protein